MRLLSFFTTVLLLAQTCLAGELNRDQRLIVACHRLDVDGVVAALRDGADVNARFGDGPDDAFYDPWSRGTPVAGKKWTPLIAVANSSDYPDPPRKVESTIEDLKWTEEQKAKVPPEQMERRRRDAFTIAQLLISHRADINADDGYGATALYTAVYERKAELAKLLVRFDAQVNTKTGIYIDGPGEKTPLHCALWSAELTKLLLDKGADPNAKDTNCETPRDWARYSDDPEVRRLFSLP